MRDAGDPPLRHPELEKTQLERQSYGAGGLLVPYTAMQTQGASSQMAARIGLSTVAVRVQGSSFATVEAQVRSSLAGQYGSDVSVAVWEGAPRGETTTISNARSTVRTFTLVVNLLGFMLPVTGCIGILSIMLAEALGGGNAGSPSSSPWAPRGTPWPASPSPAPCPSWPWPPRAASTGSSPWCRP